MTLPIVLGIAGCIALLTGLFGGGIKAKEIEVPRISSFPRIISVIVGLILIGFSMWLINPNFILLADNSKAPSQSGEVISPTPILSTSASTLISQPSPTAEAVVPTTIATSTSIPQLAPTAVVNCSHPSLASNKATTITFRNQSPRTVQLFWVDLSGKEQIYDTLNSGGWVTDHTYVNYSWCVRDRDTGVALSAIIATVNPQEVIIP